MTNRIMIRGHEAIVHDEPPTQTHNEYPLHMVHPGFQPATVGEEVTHPSGRFKYHVGGTSIRFPPVLVLNADQRAYQESQGYVVQGKSNPDAFARAMQSLSTSPTQERIEYPKWVGGVLCNSPEEEAVAAEKRRAQLGIVHKTDQDYVAEGLEREDAMIAGIKSPEQLQIEALQAQIAEMNANMAKLLALVPATAAAPPPDNLDEIRRLASAGEPLIDIHKDTDPSSLTHGQKIAAGRARKAAERAAQQGKRAVEPSVADREEAA